VVLGEGDEPSAQFLFVVIGQGSCQPLGRTVLTHHATGPAFFDPERLFEHHDCSTTGVRG
jgi:hypothetical protein